MFYIINLHIIFYHDVLKKKERESFFKLFLYAFLKKWFKKMLFFINALYSIYFILSIYIIFLYLFYYYFKKKEKLNDN